jgi:hypothetical protein
MSSPCTAKRLWEPTLWKHWNRISPKEEPLQFELDFTDEAQWRRNFPVEQEEVV